MVRFAAAALALLTSFVGLTAAGSQIMLLDFSSPTCGPCRQMEPLIHSFEQAGYPIRKVDTSQEPQLAMKYNVTRVPCLVMLVDGREITRNVGMVDSNQLQQMFKQARDAVTQTPRENRSPEATPRSPEFSEKREETTPADPEFAALLNATVRLRVDDGKFRSFGTGTIIDSRQGEALLITCGHLFRDSKGKGPVSVELFEVTNGVLRVAGQVSGWVLSYDLERDVALVVIKPGRPVTVAPIAPPGSRVERGDRVASIGCSNGADPTVLPTRITMIDRYQGPPNIEAAGAPVEGRSGGGLFNEKGQLVGVCNSADYEGNEGLYAALDSIHDEVGRLNLMPEKGPGKTNGDAGWASDSQPNRGRTGPLVRGQDDPLVETPAPRQEPTAPAAATSTTIGPTTLPTEKPAGLNPAEQAAWDEIVKRAAQSEVIVIVRPKEAGGQSEVITLDNVSPGFVQAIAGRQREPQAPVTR